MSLINILIVEDEPPISQLIETSLTQAGYRCTCVFDGPSCANILETCRFDLVLLDVMLPGLDGFELLPYIREYHTPAIFITARREIADRVKGLKMGAEDYITKPFSIQELLARVEVVLRRENKLSGRLTTGDLILDLEAHTVTKAGVPSLSPPRSSTSLSSF